MGLLKNKVEENKMKTKTILVGEDEFNRLANAFFSQANRDYRYLDTTKHYDSEHGFVSFEIESRELNSVWGKNEHKILGEVYKPSCDRIRFEYNVIRSKYGFMDATGVEIIPPIYDRASDFKHDMAVVEIDGEYGIIGKFGETIVPIKYQNTSNATVSSHGSVDCYSGNLFQIVGEIIIVKCPHGKWDIYNKSGEFICQLDNGNSSINCEYGGLKHTSYISAKGDNLLDIIIRVEDYSKRLKDMKKAVKKDKERLADLYKKTFDEYVEYVRKDIRDNNMYKATAKELIGVIKTTKKKDEFYQALTPMLEEEIDRYVETFDPHPAD